MTHSKQVSKYFEVSYTPCDFQVKDTGERVTDKMEQSMCVCA